ncbi:leucine-rich repeat domain-containing protein [Saprospira grandis]|uniref:leucine-rich repeat domain-containing protein n=1 Tax=Saprospira grandis TaxID=1008 RepID=UPI0022DE08DB|nr:leucine-rich repeat domain-containing protein [Saprospira grandis]WBM75949.1 leucine-rich repeat domain-containing protein [Saprospira grandis]
MKTNSYFLAFVFLLLASLPILAQEDGEYYSLKDALAANPKEVYGLYLSQENFSSGLPKGLEAFTNLKELMINNSKLSKLSDIWGAFPNLEYLDLSDNRIEELPPSFSQLSKLKTLSLSHSRIGSASLKQIAALKNLEELSLSNDTTFRSANWDAFASLKKLKKLELGGCWLKDFPKVFAQLPALTYLDLHMNLIEEINVSFGPNLEYLDLSEGRLTHLDIEAKGLKSLLIGFTPIRSFPKRLDQLTYLNLQGSIHSNIPSQVMAYSQLKELVFRGTIMREVSANLTQLQHLEKLDLSGNEIEELPAFFSELPNLKELNLDSNLLRVNSLKEPMRKLKVLSINQYMVTMKETFFKGKYMPALEELYMSRGNCYNTPDFTGANQLKIIYMDDHSVSNVHPSLAELPLLEVLDLSGNDELIFPAGMEKLPLTSLNISSCIDAFEEEEAIYEFPAFIAKLRNLEFLEIANVPYAELPDNWASKAILDYLDVSGTKLPYKEIKEIGVDLEECTIVR